MFDVTISPRLHFPRASFGRRIFWGDGGGYVYSVRRKSFVINVMVHSIVGRKLKTLMTGSMDACVG